MYMLGTYSTCTYFIYWLVYMPAFVQFNIGKLIQSLYEEKQKHSNVGRRLENLSKKKGNSGDIKYTYVVFIEWYM